jgi:hypothetical protein
MRKTTLFAWCVCVAGSGGIAAAQTFQTGDLYLVSSSLPRAGGGAEAGVCRVVPGTYAVTRIYTGAAATFGRATFDSNRQRLVLPNGGTSFLQIAADGSTSPLSFTGGNGTLPAAAGDGRIYFVRGSAAGAGLAMIDASGATVNVLDEAGTATAVMTTGTLATFWDTTTQTLLLGQERPGGANGLERITLSADGHQVLSRFQTSFFDNTGSEVITGFSPGPNGRVFIKLDDNTGGSDGRLKTVEVSVLAVTTFAFTDYFGVGGEVAGAYMPTIGSAIVLDTLSDNLRVFAPMSSGAGAIVQTAGVSSPGGSGELAQFVVVSQGGPSCGSADFDCDGDVGTDADIESFFACLAGTCPAPPCGSTADFNGDGDVGTDADIEAFFRVLAGGNC